MRRDVQIRRIQAYLDHGILVARKEIKHHNFEVLSAFFFDCHPVTQEPLECGTIGCACGSFALSDVGRRAGFTIRRLADGRAIAPEYKGDRGETGLADYLGISDDDGYTMAGTGRLRLNYDADEINRMARIARQWIRNLKAGRKYNELAGGKEYKV